MIYSLYTAERVWFLSNLRVFVYLQTVCCKCYMFIQSYKCIPCMANTSITDKALLLRDFDLYLLRKCTSLSSTLFKSTKLKTYIIVYFSLVCYDCYFCSFNKDQILYLQSISTEQRGLSFVLKKHNADLDRVRTYIWQATQSTDNKSEEWPLQLDLERFCLHHFKVVYI